MARQDQTIRYSIEVDGSKGLRDIADGLKSIADAGGDAAPQATALLESLKSLASNDSLITNLVKEKAALQETGDALALAKVKLADLQKQIAATTTPSNALQKSFENTQKSVASLDAAYNSHQAAITKTSNALAAAGVSTTNLDSAQRAVQASIAGVAAESANLGKNMGTVATATEAAGEKAATAGGLFAGLKDHLVEIVSIAAAVELALKGIEFGKESLQGAEQVEASLSRVKALASGAADSFANLDKTVEDAARAVNVSTQTSANGLAALAAQGLTAEQSISALVPTLQLAKIAQEDVGTAAETVARLIKAYGDSAGSAANVVDMLTAASHGAAGGLGEISKSAALLAPDAKAIGLGFNDVVGALGLLASKGIEGKKSVEGLRTVFQDLENPTSNLRGDLLALGDGTSDFTKAIAALGQNTPVARDALNNLSGSARSLVQALVQAGPGAIERFNAGLQNTQGTATKTAAAIDDNLLGAATKFGNAIEALGEKLVQPILKPFTEELTKLAGQLNDFADSKDFDQIRDAVTQMATSAAKALDDFLHSIDWQSFASDAKTSIQGIAESLSALASSAKAAGTALSKVGDTVGTIYHGVGTALSGVVAVAAKSTDALVTTAGKLSGIKDDGTAAAQGLENVHNALESLGDSATQKFEEHSKGVVDNLDAIAGVSGDAAEGITKTGDAAGTAAPAMAAHAAAAKTAAEASTELATSLQTVPTYLDQTADSAKAAFPFVDRLSDSIQNIGGGAIQTAREHLAEAAQAFADLQKSADATPEAMEAARQSFIKASNDLDKLTASAGATGDSLLTAFQKLGLVSESEAKVAIQKLQAFFDTVKAGSDSSAAGINDVTNAFLAMATKQLQISSLLDQASQDEVRRTLESQAAALGLSRQLSQLEAQAGRTGSALSNIGQVKPPQALSTGLGQITTAVGETSKAVTEATQNAEKGFTEWGDAADAASLATQHITADTSHANDGMQRLSQAIKQARDGFLSISDSAAQFYDTILQGSFKQALANDDAGAGFDRVSKAIQVAFDETSKAIANERTQLAGTIDQINQLGVASAGGFGAFGSNAEAAAAKMKGLADLIADGKYQAGLLGKQDLAPLQQALEAAAQRAQQLADKTKQAISTFEDLVNSAQDALDQAAGNQDAIEDRRHAKQLADLEAAAKVANKLNSQEYNQAVANENALHALKLKNIATQQKAQNGGGSGSGSSTSSGGIGAVRQTGGAVGAVQPIELHLHLENAMVIGSKLDDAANQLAKPLLKELQKIQHNSRVNIITNRPN